jgi:glutathione S-transferase
MKLVVGTKRYSSWSLRPWILMKYFGVPFEEYLIPFEMRPGTRENTAAVQGRMQAVSPNGRVPVLILDDGTAINESLCICEFINDKFLGGRAWPADGRKYLAKSMCLEMATGFIEMRRLLPMSIGSVISRCAEPPHAARKDISRVIEMLALALSRSGSEDFLFGSFTIADAYFLPVLFRFETYRVPLRSDVRGYFDRMMALPAVAEWRGGDDDCPTIQGIANIVSSYPREVADACKI